MWLGPSPSPSREVEGVGPRASYTFGQLSGGRTDVKLLRTDICQGENLSPFFTGRTNESLMYGNRQLKNSYRKRF